MDFTPPLAEPDPVPPDPAQQRTDRHLRMLAELAALGMDLARALHRQAMSQAAEAPAGPPSNAPTEPGAEPRAESRADPALHFTRVARAVRQTVALEARLAEDRDTRQERRQAALARQAADAAREAAARRRTQIRRRIVPQLRELSVSRRIRLMCDLDAKLDDDAEDLCQLPLAEAVARICRDLGIAPDRIPALAGADGTAPEATAGPDEGGAAMAPAATRPRGAWVPVRPPPSISPHLVDPLPPRGAVSGAGPPP